MSTAAAVGAAVGADVEDAAVGVDAELEGLEDPPQAATARVPIVSAKTASGKERTCIAPVYPQSGQALHTLRLRRRTFDRAAGLSETREDSTPLRVDHHVQPLDAGIRRPRVDARSTGLTKLP
jgi:hypothetical protein